MSVSSSPDHALSKKASNMALSFEETTQADMPSTTAEAQVDKDSPAFPPQALAYGLKSNSKFVCVGNQSDWTLISYERPEPSASEDPSRNASDRLQITVIKNKEDLFPALVGFLGGAQKRETSQVTSAPSEL